MTKNNKPESSTRSIKPKTISQPSTTDTILDPDASVQPTGTGGSGNTSGGKGGKK